MGGNVEKELSQNVEIKKTSKNKDNKIGEPEEHLCSFMRYLKNHWPRIFKFINAVCNFFNRSKNDNKIGLENIMNKGSKHGLHDKTLDLSSQKYTTNKPQNMETSEILK